MISQAVIDGTDIFVYFEAVLPGLSLTTFTIVEHESACDSCAFISSPSQDFSSVMTDDLEVYLNENGLITSVVFGGETYDTQEKFVKFGSS